MCVIYSHRSACMYYQILLYVCLAVYICIGLPFTYTLGGDDIKGVIHYSSTKYRALHRFTYYTRVYYSAPD